MNFNHLVTIFWHLSIPQSKLRKIKPAPLVSFQVESHHTSTLDFYFFSSKLKTLYRKTNQPNKCKPVVESIRRSASFKCVPEKNNRSTNSDMHGNCNCSSYPFLWSHLKDHDMHLRVFQSCICSLWIEAVSEDTTSVSACCHCCHRWSPC